MSNPSRRPFPAMAAAAHVAVAFAAPTALVAFAAPAALVAFAAPAALVAFAAPAALAGPAQPIKECPPEHRLTQARALEAPPDEGAVREVLTYVDVTGFKGIDGLALRIRRITVRPGGFVPLHWHNDRPSVDYLVAGEIVEHNAFCAVPLAHEAGQSSNRFGDFLGHWWENKTGKDVVLLSADIVAIEDAEF